MNKKLTKNLVFITIIISLIILYFISIVIHNRMADKFYQSGVIKFDQQKYEEASKDFKEATRLKPTFVDAYIYSGISKDLNGDPDGAIKEYELALKYNPNYEQFRNIYTCIGNAESNKGNRDSAIKNYNIALSFDPDNDVIENNIKLELERKTAINNKEMLVNKDKDFSKKKIYGIPISKSMPDVDIFYKQGIDLYNQKQYRKAIKYFEKVINIDSNFVDAYIYIGICCSLIEKYDKAMEYLNIALTKNPNNCQIASILNNRGIVKSYKDASDGAIKDFNTVLSMDFGYKE